MARKSRQASPTGVYHFINRGVNKKKLFHRKEDFERYLGLVREYSLKLSAPVYHYCIMPNHSHILLRCSDVADLSRFGHFIQRRYAYYYCKAYHWSEQVFRKRFMSIPIEDDAYLSECGRYIERNPLKAKMVDDLKDYPYSSYSYYAEGKPDSVVTPSPAYLEMGRTTEERISAYRSYATQARPYELLVDKALEAAPF